MATSVDVWPRSSLLLDRVRDGERLVVREHGRKREDRASLNALAEEEIAQRTRLPGARAPMALELALRPEALRSSVRRLPGDRLDNWTVESSSSSVAERVTSGLQRIGAPATTWQTSSGILVELRRVVELAIDDAMREGEVEPTIVPQNALECWRNITAMVSVDDWRATICSPLFRAHTTTTMTRAR